MKHSRSIELIFPIFGVFLLALAVWALSNELRHYHPSEIRTSLEDISRSRLWEALLLTPLGYGVITAYDLLAFRYVRVALNYSQVIFIAFVSYAISNTLGFALLTGGALRYRFFSRWGVTKSATTQIIAFGNLSFWLGLFAVGGVTFILEPLALPRLVHLPFLSARPIGAVFLVLVAFYLLICWRTRSLTIRNQRLFLPSVRLSLAQIGVSALDWAIAAAVLYVLLPNPMPLSYPAFFGIYLLGITAAIISHVPGGLGVFETVILFLLPEAVSPPDAVGSLLAYRAVYFLLPFIVAVLLLGFYELYQRLKVQW